MFDADPNDQLLAIGAALTCFRWLLVRRIEAEGARRGRQREQCGCGRVTRGREGMTID